MKTDSVVLEVLISSNPNKQYLRLYFNMPDALQYLGSLSNRLNALL